MRGRLLITVTLLPLLLAGCETYHVSDVQTEAQACHENGGRVEINSDQATYSCVTRGFFTRVWDFVDGKLTNIFAVVLLICMFVGVVMYLLENKRDFFGN